jgi:hypothetical protein
MKTQPRLAIRVVAAALALSACGIAAGTSAGTPVAYAIVMPTGSSAPGDTSRFADLRALAQVKRDVAWATVERAWAGERPRGAGRGTGGRGPAAGRVPGPGARQGSIGRKNPRGVPEHSACLRGRLDRLAALARQGIMIGTGQIEEHRPARVHASGQS